MIETSGGVLPRRGLIQRIPRRIRIGALVLLGSAVVIWNVFPPSVPQEPVILARDADGTLRDQREQGGARLTFNAHVGELKSENSTFCGSSSSHSNPAFFAARHLIIINRSDDILMERVGVELIESLKTELAVDRLEYYPLGHMPELGSLSPDFYVTLDLDNKKVSGLLSEKLDAAVKATLGTTLSKSSFTSHDHLTPPLVNLHANVEVQHKSTYLGVESSAAAYILQGRDIAKQITSQLKAKFEAAREDHGPIPEMPSGLAEPAWSPIPEFDFLRSLKAEVETSTHRMMMHNETFWRLTTDKTADKLFAIVKEELVEKNWRIDHEETSFPRSSILRLVDGSRVLKVFPAGRNELPSSSDDAWPERVEFFVHYRDRVSTDVIESAIGNVLDQPEPDVDFLLVFHSRASGEQRPKIISLLEGQKPGTSASWMALADHYSSRKDVDGCCRALRMLTCLVHLARDGSAISNKVRDIAKKHDIRKSDYELPGREYWLKVGLIELPEEGEAERIEFGLGVQAGFFEIDSEGKATVYSIVINEIGDSQLEGTHMKCSGGSRSWSTGRALNSSQKTDQHSFSRHPNNGRLEMTTEQLAPKRFRTSVRLHN